jgi:hypothetical protein
LYAGYIFSDLLDRRRQLGLTAPGYEDVCAFTYKLLRGGEANATVATGNERNFTFKLTHIFSP